MKINLRIDQIVVEGTSLTRREREHLTAALEHELARQLRERVTREGGQPAMGGWKAAGTQLPAGTQPPAGAQLPAGVRTDQEASDVSRLGRRIAHDVLAALPALPAGALADSRPAVPSRRQSRRGRP